MDISTALLAGTVTAAAGAYYLASSSTTPATLGPIPSRLKVLAAQEAKDTGSKEKYVWSYQMPGRKEGESPVVRSLLSKDELVAFVDPDVHTLYDNFKRGVEKFGNTNCLGHRPTATSPYVWRTFNEVMEEATLVGSALASFEADRHIGICSINRPEWVIAEQAVNAYSMTLVPLYDTFGEESLCFIINQSGMEIVFAHPDRVELMFRCAASSPSLKTVISLGDDISKHEGKVPAGIRLLSFAQAKEIGKANRIPHRPPHEDQVATICYTSGTTGMPKGALLSHKNIMSDVTGTMLCGAIVVTPGDVHVSYLPLAHMFERIVITFMLQFGASTGFYRGDVRTLFDDIKILRPTIFASVPKIYSRIFDKVMNGVSNSAVSRTIFNYAFEVKRKQLPYNQYKHALWDKIVFSKVQDMFGGRIRIMLSGSAPMAYKTIEFLRIVFGCEVYEGYGQTECAAASSVTVPGVATMGCTSVPLPCAEMKLVDVPEMGFLTTNTPPQGEVWIRGPLVFQGYFKNPELTSEALTEDGWLKTGDVGQLNADSTFQIIDRKKNIFKLSQGEYISPEKVENTLTQSKYVMMAFAYGDSFKSSVVAIIVPDPDVIKTWAASQNIVASVEDLCSNEALKKEILDDINQTCRARKLNGYEIPRAIHLEHRPFTPESEIVTPTMKLKRPFAKRYYEAAINNLYTELNE